MRTLFHDPAPTDLQGWRDHLRWLRSHATPAQPLTAEIEDAELQVSLIEAQPASSGRDLPQPA